MSFCYHQFLPPTHGPPSIFTKCRTMKFAPLKVISSYKQIKNKYNFIQLINERLGNIKWPLYEQSIIFEKVTFTYSCVYSSVRAAKHNC